VYDRMARHSRKASDEWRPQRVPPVGPFPFWAMIGVAGTMGALETCHDARIECLPAVKILSGDRALGLDAVCEGILFENSVRSNH
jgi:hypothetical protein